MTSQFAAAVAALGLLGAGVSGATETRAFDAIPGVSSVIGAGQGGAVDDRCKVDVIRDRAPGSADITRKVLENGGCVCIINTGKAPTNGSAEDIVSALLRDRTCEGAPAAVTEPVAHVAPAGIHGPGLVLPGVLVIGGLIGLAASAGKDSKG